ncbi:MAG TPA: hypothetical protein VF550_06400 [Polyangia bacterium]
MEHLTLAVAVRRESILEKQAVEVRGAPEGTGGAMNGCDRAVLAGGKPAVSLALKIPPRDVHQSQRARVDGQTQK